MGDGGQLDLFGGGAPKGRAGALRFVSVDAPGRLGIGPIDVDVAKLRAEHKVSVLVVVGADPSEVVARAASVEDLDVRHASGAEGALAADVLARHAAALAADARFGRRAVAISDDDALAALLVAAALMRLGASPPAAREAVGHPAK